MPRFRKTIIGNPYCEFCGTLKYERALMFDWCDKYRAKSHVKSANAYSGVKIINYVMDNHYKIKEKPSKLFAKFRFCPVCGFDYLKQEAYNGKTYIAANVNTLWEIEQKKGGK